MTAAALFVLCGGNALAMIAMNAGVMAGSALPAVYGVSLGVAGILAWLVRAHLPRLDTAVAGGGAGRLLFPLLAVTFLLLLGPRAVYLVEPFTGLCIDPVCWDDYWHIQEITALVDAPSFPVRSTIEPERWLSFYYAPWMLSAAVWHLLPAAFQTVKIALFIGWTATGGLALGFLAVAASRVAASRAAFAVLVYLVFWQSGARSIFAFAEPAASHEWWMARVGSTLGLGTVASGAVWTVHHLVSAAAVLLAFMIADAFLAAAEKPEGRAGSLPVVAGAGLLMASAVLGSTFVVLGALPLLGWWLGRRGRPGAVLSARVAAAASLLVLPVLWLFLGREIMMRPAWGAVVPGGSPLIYCIVLYLLLMFADIGMPAFALFLGEKDRSGPAGEAESGRVVPWAAAALAIPFFVIFSGTSNNLALRGTLLPLLALMPWAASRWVPHWRRPPVLLLALLLSLGTASEIASCWSRAVRSLNPDPVTHAIRLRLHHLNLGRLRRNDEHGKARERMIAGIGASVTGRPRPAVGAPAGLNPAVVAAFNALLGDVASLSAMLDASPDRRLRWLAERRLPPALGPDGRRRPIPLAAMEISNTGPSGPWSWQRRD